jgi:hypothetical protein
MQSKATDRPGLTGHAGAPLLLTGIVTAALWFSHMPSLLLHAQFYADDGGWYQTAYSQGPLSSLLQPDAGYLVLLQRLAAAAALAFPPVAAPTLFDVVALLVEVAGICYLLSSRMSAAIPRPWARVAIALTVIVLPNAYDTSGNLTNAQWHLALIAFLVIFASPPRGLWGWICDGVILLLCGLTGPYSLLLAPVALWRWLESRGDHRRLLLLVAITACAAVQMAVIATHSGQRTSGPLAAGALPLVTMLGRQVTLGLTAGAHGLAALAAAPLADNPAMLTLLAAIPVAACAWAAWRGPEMLRALCLLALLELILALAAPSIDPPRWPNLGKPADVVHFHPGGIRYFLYPLLAFAISLGWLVWTGLPGVRRQGPAAEPGRSRIGGRAAALAGAGAAVTLLLAAGAGVPRDWLYPPYLDLHWAAQIQRLDAAPPGTRVVIPINPRGWTLTLAAPQR